MSVQTFQIGDDVCLTRDYVQDEGGKNFRAGEKGRVSGRDAFMVIVSIAPRSGYRISVRPALLERVSKN